MGELMFKKGSAEQCAKHCDELVRSLEDEILNLSGLTRVVGFGGFHSGSELDAGFSQKAHLAIEAMKAHADHARQLAQNFRSVEQSYASQDSDSADDIAVTMGRGLMGASS